MGSKPAARVGDDIAHSNAGLGMALGVAAGVVAGAVLVGATIATGGAALAVVAAVGGAAALTSAGGLGGMYVGEASMGPPTGKFTTGSPNVLVNGRPATMTFASFATCAKDPGSIPLATGSRTVHVNMGLAGREGEKLGCSAVSVKQTSPNVFIGGESQQDPRVPIHPEVPPWAVTTLQMLGVAGAVLALPFAIATVGVAATIGGGVLGFVGAGLGGKGGRMLGEALGLSEAGVRAMEVAGGFVGGMVGGAAGTRGTQAFNNRYQIKVDPNTLGMNGGNVRIVRRPQPPAGGVDLKLKHKDSWTPSQRAEAAAKAKILNDADTRVTQSQRSGTSAASRYRRAGNAIPANSDVDHAVDLQLGGADNVSNMWPLNSSVNRSLGSQIHHQIKDLPIGTKVNKVTIGD